MNHRLLHRVLMGLLQGVLTGLFIGAAPLWAQVPLLTESEAPVRVLLVDLDDVGHDLVARAHTPTLDRLTREGRFFPRLVTSPSCSPTRAMLMTGAQQSHPANLMGRVLIDGSKGRDDYALPPEGLVLLPRLVTQSGRRTAKVGKWHLCEPHDPAHPTACGWQSYAGVLGNLVEDGLSYVRYPKVVDGEVQLVEGRYLTVDETDDAIAQVKAHVDLVSLSYHATHGPWEVPPSELLRADAAPESEPDLDQASLAALMLEACDRELGRLLTVAAKHDYTVLVFGDNGSSSQAGASSGRGKATLHDSGVIVPLWAIGPGVEPGVDRSLVSIVDFYDTVADLFGIDSARADQGPHSMSFAGALRGEPHLREWAVAELFGTVGKDPRKRRRMRWTRMARGERFKLIWNREKDAPEPSLSLFDTVADPDESIDLLEPGELAEEASRAFELLKAALDTV